MEPEGSGAARGGAPAGGFSAPAGGFGEWLAGELAAGSGVTPGESSGGGGGGSVSRQLQPNNFQAATNGQTSTIGPTTGAITFSGILAVIYGVAGPVINVSWAPTKKVLCSGGGIGVSAGHTLSGGPVVVHAKQGKKIKDVLGGWSLGGGYNWLPWLGAQASANTSGGTAGASFGIPGASGTLTYSGCHVFAGGSE
jgi:hypothetical protein